MNRRVNRRAHQFSDGSELEFAVRTSDAAVRRIFEADLSRRLRAARRLLADAPPRGTVPAGHADTRRSTTTHALPDGEVTVSIDASGAASHEYLHTLVRGAVEYTNALHVDVGPASALAVALLGGGLALAGAGPAVASLPLFAAGAVFAAYLLVYWLSARGIAPALSRIPEPTGHGR